MNLTRRNATSLILSSLALAGPSIRSAGAQDSYPSKPLLLTHGFGAGGNADVVSRIVADAISPLLGQPVTTEPRPGAGGNIASGRLVKSPPDGYTLITLTGGHAVSGAIYKALPFHPVDDFQMISIYGYQAFLVGVRAHSPITSIAELIAAAKAAPGKLTYSSVGVGSTQHLAGELFCSMAGVQMTHVPYRGGAAPMTDLLGGQIDVSFDTITVIEPQYRGGKVRILGVTSEQPWWSLPEIMPIAKTVPGYDVRTWLGMAAPKGMPQPVVERLNKALREGLVQEAAKVRLQKVGLDVLPSSPDEMRTFVAGEIAKWRKVVSEAKIPQQ